jgi:hypothetical protein
MYPTNTMNEELKDQVNGEEQVPAPEAPADEEVVPAEEAPADEAPADEPAN